MTLEFLLTSLVVVASPGTGALYTVATGLARGGQMSVVAAFGCTLGIVPHMAAAILGLAAILHASAVAFETLKWAGVAYLLWTAWMVWQDRGALRLDAGSSEVGADARSSLRVILTAILLNLLNPKLSIFFLAFLPQFVAAEDAAPVARMLLLSGVFMLMTFVVFALYGLFAAAVRDHVIGRPRVLAWMRRTFAGAFVLLGARLATAER